MKTKKVNRYSCDYCGRASLAAWFIRKHEGRCTLNRERHCGLCAFLEFEQANMDAMLALLPDPADHKRPEYDDQGRYCGHAWNGLEEAVNAVLPKLREMASNCPACIMAALRLKNIPVPEITEFKFKDECKALMDEKNQRDYEDEIRRERAYGAY